MRTIQTSIAAVFILLLPVRSHALVLSAIGGEEDPLLLVKKITITNAKGDVFEQNLTYYGNKLRGYIKSDGYRMNCTYKGDLITKFEEIGPDHKLSGTHDFVYEDNKLVIETIDHIKENDKLVKTYSHTSDTVVAFVETNWSKITKKEMIIKSGTLYFSKGNLIKEEYKDEKGHTQTVIYSHDKKANPFKNILGYDKLIYEESALNNIIEKRTISEMSSQESLAKHHYKYNPQGYPLEETQFEFEGVILESVVFSY